MPNLAQTIARYREHANGYDESARRTMWVRERTIDRLDLRPGDRVLDVACGTGLSLDALCRAVGPTGQVVGVEVSPEMMAIARERVREAGWGNVHLLRAPVETAAIAGRFDAVLFHFTHDVMRSPQALERIFGAVEQGARIAFAGMKYAPRWMLPVNVIVRAKARPYMTTFDGLNTPWDLALPFLAEFSWYPVLFGTAYVGWGRARGCDTSRPVRAGHADARPGDPDTISLVG